MRADEILLTNNEIHNIWIQYLADNTEKKKECAYGKRIAKNQCMKLLNALKYEGLIEHTIYDSGLDEMHTDDCKLCALDNILKESK